LSPFFLAYLVDLLAFFPVDFDLETTFFDYFLELFDLPPELFDLLFELILDDVPELFLGDDLFDSYDLPFLPFYTAD
jgi:hypothetical protein